MSGWMKQGDKKGWLKVQAKDDEMAVLGKGIKTILKASPFMAGGLGTLYVLYKLGLFDNRTGATDLGGAAESVTDFLKAMGVTVGTGAALAGLGAYGLHRYYRHKYDVDNITVKITPHASTTLSRDNVLSLVAGLWRSYRPKLQRILKGREWFTLLFHCHEGRHEKGDIRIYFTFPRDRYSFIMQLWRDNYPGISLTEVERLPFQAPIEEGDKDISIGAGGYLVWNDRKYRGFPLKSFQGDHIAAILSHMQPGTVLSFAISPGYSKDLKKAIKATREKLLKSKEPYKEATLKQLAARQMESYPFHCFISIWDEFGRDFVVNSLLNAINTQLATQNSFRLSYLSKIPFINLNPLERKPRTGIILTAKELATLFHLPQGKPKGHQGDHIYDRLIHVMPGQSIIDQDEFTKGVYVGSYINPAQDNRPLYVPSKQFRFHSLIIGKTGAGKTAFALDMATDLIEKKLRNPKQESGFIVIDPKQSFVKNLVTRINKLRLEGKYTENHSKYFHYFDVQDQDFCFGLNPLEKPDNRPLGRQESEKVIEKTLDVLRAAWSAESITFERYGRLILKALLADNQQHTLLSIPEFLREDSALRARLIKQLTLSKDTYHNEIARDLQEEDRKGTFTSSKLEPLLNRLSRIKENATLRRVFGQQNTTLQFREWLQEGHITLINADGLGEDQRVILMGFLLWELHRYARTRTNSATNYYIFIDEAHNVRNIDVIPSKMIPEDREFGLCLFLMTQMLQQFPEKFFDAITEVAGVFGSTRAGLQNARLMEKITNKRMQAEYIEDLQPLHLFLDVTTSKNQRTAVLIKNNPPVVYNVQGEATYYGEDTQRTGAEKEQAFQDCIQSIAKDWIERDCRNIEEVEREINEYLTEFGKIPITGEELKKETDTPRKKRKQNAGTFNLQDLAKYMNGIANTNTKEVNPNDLN